jgi:hypothetical protein
MANASNVLIINASDVAQTSLGGKFGADVPAYGSGTFTFSDAQMTVLTTDATRVEGIIIVPWLGNHSRSVAAKILKYGRNPGA